MPYHSRLFIAKVWNVLFIFFFFGLILFEQWTSTSYGLCDKNHERNVWMDELVGLNQTKCILKRETTTTKTVSHDIEPWKEMAERKTQRIEIKSTISNLKITQYKLPVTRYGSSRMKIDLKHVTHKAGLWVHTQTSKIDSFCSSCSYGVVFECTYKLAKKIIIKHNERGKKCYKESRWGKVGILMMVEFDVQVKRKRQKDEEKKRIWINARTSSFRKTHNKKSI